MNLNKKKSLRILKRVAVFFFGIAIPLASFVLSSELGPLAKDAARFNFLSLLISSKILLFPLALYAVVAFFRTQIYPRREPARWETMGLCVGVIVATVSLVSGFLYEGLSFLGTATAFVIGLPLQSILSPQNFFFALLFMFLSLAPFYTPIWYGWAARKALQRNKEQSTSSAAIATFVSLPFMGAALIYALRLYENLPDVTERCYIASATATTPAYFLSTIPHPDTGQPISRQLLIFKAFEYAWIESSGVSHSIFRSIYDVIGQILARLISLHPLIATLAYLSLKPAEAAALKYLELIPRKNKERTRTA